MSFQIPLSNMPEDPFVTTSGQSSFIVRLINSAATAPAPTPAPAPVSTATDAHELPEDLPNRPELFKSKEVDSGIIYTETPSIVRSSSTVSEETTDEQSMPDTPESSIIAGGTATSVASLLKEGADDQDQVMRLLSDVFRLTQLTSPRCALVFVGKQVFSKKLTTLILLTSTLASRPP